jgi:glucan endo-1,3-alpha-glucosidase
VISWNDFGESHYIAPIRGAQPGSEAWTEGMEHEAFREMTRWFANRWRRGATSAHAGQGTADGSAEFDVDGENRDEVRVWGWWRTHPSDVVASDDPVGRPTHAEWVSDLLHGEAIGEI